MFCLLQIMGSFLIIANYTMQNQQNKGCMMK